MKISELEVGMRVSVPKDVLTDVYPWQERYGSVIEIKEVAAGIWYQYT